MVVLPRPEKNNTFQENLALIFLCLSVGIFVTLFDAGPYIMHASLSITTEPSMDGLELFSILPLRPKCWD